MEVLKDLLEEDASIATKVLVYLKEMKATTVAALALLFEDEPTSEHLAAFSLKSATQWKFLKTSVLSRIEKEGTTQQGSINEKVIPYIDDAQVQKIVDEILTMNLEMKSLNTQEASQKKALGPLYKEGEVWPVVETGDKVAIDMRLYSWSNLGYANELTPAAEIINNQLLRRYAFTMGLIACSGSGKTSSIFSLGNKHFVVFIDAGGYENINRTEMPIKYGSLHYDTRFGKLSRMIEDLMSKLTGKEERHRREKLEKAARFFSIEFLTRLFHLLKLLTKTKEKPLQPLDFLHHQACGGYECDFSENVFKTLETFDKDLIAKIVDKCCKDILLLTGEKQRVVFAVDEIGVAKLVQQDSFLRGNGFLEPIVKAASPLSEKFKSGLILAGTGTSKEHTYAIVTMSVAKVSDESIIYQDKFPPVSSENIENLLNRLSLDEFILKESPLVRFPINKSFHFDLKDDDTIVKKYLKAYVLESRGRMLAGIIERIPKIYDENQNIDKNQLFLKAMEKCIEDAESTLFSILNTRVLPPNSIYSDAILKSIDFLQRAYVAASLTNGSMGLTGFPGVLNDPGCDLVELGVAIVRDSKENVYKITERFVLNTLQRFFDALPEDKRRKIDWNRYKSNVEILRSLIQTHEKTFKAKGNILEYIFLDRLLDYGKKKLPLKELPFIGEKCPSKWGDIIFKPQRIWRPMKDKFTADFLIREESKDCVCWVEDVCRPDAIVMLDVTKGKAKAISMASAVYSNVVTTNKCRDQLYSAAVSEAYKGKMGGANPKTTKQRQIFVDDEHQLDKTQSICLIIALPTRQSNEFPTESLAEKNTYIHLDKTNIYHLLGEEKDAPEGLYSLLAYITNTKKNDWIVSSGRSKKLERDKN